MKGFVLGHAHHGICVARVLLQPVGLWPTSGGRSKVVWYLLQREGEGCAIDWTTFQPLIQEKSVYKVPRAQR